MSGLLKQFEVKICSKTISVLARRYI